MIWVIRVIYLIIEVICAEWSFFSCALFLARWLFSRVEIELPLEARFNSDWCNAFLLACCLRKWMFNSVELDRLGLDDKNNSALCSEFFLQSVFLIKGRWFITSIRRGNPVPCCQNMHFLGGNERSKIVAVDTFFWRSC